MKRSILSFIIFVIVFSFSALVAPAAAQESSNTVMFWLEAEVYALTAGCPSGQMFVAENTLTAVIQNVPFVLDIRIINQGEGATDVEANLDEYLDFNFNVKRMCYLSAKTSVNEGSTLNLDNTNESYPASLADNVTLVVVDGNQFNVTREGNTITLEDNSGCTVLFAGRDATAWGCLSGIPFWWTISGGYNDTPYIYHLYVQ